MFNPFYLIIILSLLPCVKRKVNNNVLLFAISILLGIFFCSREVGNSFGVINFGNDDAFAYVELAKYTQNKSIQELISEFFQKPGGNEPIYMAYLKIIGFFSINPLAIYFPIILISFFTLFKVADAYTLNPFLVVLLFLSICQPYFLMLLTQWRFYLAFSVILYTVSALARGTSKIRIFLIGAVIAGSIHITSVFIIFHYYLFTIKNRLITFIALFLPITLIYALREYGGLFNGKIAHYSGEISNLYLTIPSGASIYIYILLSIWMIFLGRFRLFAYAGYGYLSISQLYFFESTGSIGTFAYRLSCAYASILCYFYSIALVKYFPRFRGAIFIASIVLLIFSFTYGFVAADWRELYSKVGYGYWYFPVFPIF